MAYIPGFGSGFQLSVNHPIDERFEVDNIAAATAGYLATAYPGLITYDKATAAHYKVVSNGGTQATLVVEALTSTSTSSVPFNEADLYDEDDIVIYLGLDYRKNSTARPANTPFSHTHFTRLLPGGAELGAFVVDGAYLENDIVLIGEVKYRANANMDKVNSLVEGTANATFTRLSSTSFTSLQAGKIYIEGDTIYLGEKSYYVSTTFTMSDPVDEATLVANSVYISNEARSKAKEYVAALNFEEGEFLRYEGSLYLVNTGWTAVTTVGSEANHTWDEIKGNLELIKEKPEVVEEFDAASTYVENDKVLLDGLVWIKNAVDRNANDAFTTDHWYRDDDGIDRGVYSDQKFYDTGDIVSATWWGETHKFIAVEPNDPPGFSTTTPSQHPQGTRWFTRITPTTSETILKTNNVYIEGDTFTLTNFKYRVNQFFATASTGPAPFSDYLDKLDVIDRDGYFELNDADTIAYHDESYAGDVWLVKQDYSARYLGVMLKEGDRLILKSNKVSANTASIEDFYIYAVDGREVTYEAFDSASTYTEGTKVSFDGFNWTRNDQVRNVNDAFSIAHFTRDDSTGQYRGEYSAGSVYLTGDTTEVNGILYKANADVDLGVAFTDGSTGATFLRMTSDFFAAPVAGKRYIHGDYLKVDEVLYHVDSEFTAPDPLPLVAAQFAEMTQVTGGAGVTEYTDGDTVKGSSLVSKDKSLYWCKEEIDGTDGNFDTWAEVEPLLVPIYIAPPSYPDFLNTETYLENVKVMYQGFVWTRNNQARPTDAAFSADHFTRDITDPVDHGELKVNTLYVQGDFVTYGGIQYTTNSTQALADLADFNEGPTATDFTRVTPQIYDTFEAGKRYVVGDFLYMNGRSFLIKTAFTSNNPDNIDNHTDKVYRISDDREVIARSYNDGDNFKSAEFLLRDSILYIVNQGWTANLTVGSEAFHNWAAVEDRVTQIAQTTVVEAVPFDDTSNYVVGDLVTYQDYVFECTTAYTAGNPFSLANFTRKVSGGEDRGLFATDTHYLVGDTVTNPANNAKYAINSSVDSVATFVVGDQAAEWTRVGPGIFTDASIVAWDTTFLKGDQLYFDMKHRSVTEDFVIGTDPADGSVPALDETKLRLEAQWDRSMVRLVTENDDVPMGETIRYGNKLYYCFDSYTPSDPVDATELEARIFELIDFEVTQFPVYDSTVVYVEDNQVSYDGQVLKRTANDNTLSNNLQAINWDRQTGVLTRTAATLAAMNDWFIGVGDIIYYQGVSLEAKVEMGPGDDKPPFDTNAFVRAGSYTFSTEFSYAGQRNLKKGDLIVDGRNKFFVTAAFSIADGTTWAEGLRDNKDNYRLVADYEASEWQADTGYFAGDIVTIGGYEVIATADHASASAITDGELANWLLVNVPVSGFYISSTGYVAAGTVFGVDALDDTDTAVAGLTVNGTLPSSDINVLKALGFRFVLNETDITDSVVVETDTSHFNLGSVFIEDGDRLHIRETVVGEGNGVADISQGTTSNLLDIVQMSTNLTLDDSNAGKVFDFINNSPAITVGASSKGASWTIANRTGSQLSVSLSGGQIAYGNVNIENNSAVTIIMLTTSHVLVSGGVA